MDKPFVAAKRPFSVEVEEGKKYFWCTCGQSSKQPFCDGCHSDTEPMPKMYTADRTRTVLFCGCGQSKRLPLCDGSHAKL